VKVSRLYKEVKAMNQDENIAVVYITEQDIVNIARERSKTITHDDIVGVLELIEDSHDNWDDVAAESLLSYLEYKEC